MPGPRLGTCGCPCLNARPASDSGSYELVESPWGWPVSRRVLRALGHAIPAWMLADAESLAARGLPPAWVALGLAWAEYESGGELGAAGSASLNERGLFQISLEEAQELGLTLPQHETLSTDRDANFDLFAALVTDRLHRLTTDARYGVAPASSALPGLVKLIHGGGPGYTLDLLRYARARGVDAAQPNVRWTDLDDLWKSHAELDNSLTLEQSGGRQSGDCLIQVDAATAVLARAEEISTGLGLGAPPHVHPHDLARTAPDLAGTQIIRAVDVFLLGPVMLLAAFGWRRAPTPLRVFLGVSGVATIAFNGVNLLRKAKPMSA